MGGGGVPLEQWTREQQAEKPVGAESQEGLGGL
jgi:hypothetical protein